MKEELTKEMHSEFRVTTKEEECLRAGCIWGVWCDYNSKKKDIEKYAKKFSLTYESAIRWRDYWLKKE